ncbi:MAG: hypothetical protein AABX66_01175 [Nanoarchaeota archaeon]
MDLLNKIGHHIKESTKLARGGRYGDFFRYQRVVLKDRWNELYEPLLFVGAVVIWPLIYLGWRNENHE